MGSIPTFLPNVFHCLEKVSILLIKWVSRFSKFIDCEEVLTLYIYVEVIN